MRRGRRPHAHASCPASIRFARWEAELAAVRAVARRDRLEQEHVVVAPPRATARPTNELGQSSRIGTPSGPSRQPQRANLTSSPLSPPNSSASAPRVGGHAVHAERGRVAPAPVGAVVCREADPAERQVDARLRGEAARQPAARRPPGRDDEHRVLEVPDQRVEGRAGLHHRDASNAATASSAGASPETTSNTRRRRRARAARRRAPRPRPHAGSRRRPCRCARGRCPARRSAGPGARSRRRGRVAISASSAMPFARR